MALSDLTEGMVLAQDVYSWDDNKVPLLSKNTVLTRHMIDMMFGHDLFEICVMDEKAPAPLLAPVLVDEELREEAIQHLENLFVIARQEDSPAAVAQVVKHIDEVVEQMVSSLLSDQDALININDLKSHDEYTYHHSLSVAVLSIAIGQSIGFKRKELNRLGRCAMLHDIGKTAIPLSILNKPSRLDTDEFAVMKTHSSEGYQYLLQNHIGDGDIWGSVLCHHERFDGAGYPNGIKGRRIPLMGRIISVADVYDALTSHRPYRTPMQPPDAIEYIMGNVSTAFDYDVVKAFLDKVELYPVGSFVELSDGRLAKVLNNDNTMRPLVSALDTGEVIDLYGDRSALSLTIKQMFMELPEKQPLPPSEQKPARAASL
jgi:HD-GYP domain-containing protein (c-di-GMP phosphodiesterase class II)